MMMRMRMKKRKKGVGNKLLIHGYFFGCFIPSTLNTSQNHLELHAYNESMYIYIVAGVIFKY